MRRWNTLAAILAAVAPLSCEESTGEDLPGIPPTKIDPAAPGAGRRTEGPVGQVRITFVAPVADEILKVMPAPELKVKVLSAQGATNDPSADPVDPQSVAYTLAAAGARETLASGKLSGPTAEGEYTGRIDLSRVQSGT